MGLRGRKSIASRFMRYVQGLVEVIGHADRAGPLQDYCTGLGGSERAQERGANGRNHGA